MRPIVLDIRLTCAKAVYICVEKILQTAMSPAHIYTTRHQNILTLNHVFQHTSTWQLQEVFRLLLRPQKPAQLMITPTHTKIRTLQLMHTTLPPRATTTMRTTSPTLQTPAILVAPKSPDMVTKTTQSSMRQLV